jgi:hypothetical protein
LSRNALDWIDRAYAMNAAPRAEENEYMARCLRAILAQTELIELMSGATELELVARRTKRAQKSMVEHVLSWKDCAGITPKAMAEFWECLVPLQDALYRLERNVKKVQSAKMICVTCFDAFGIIKIRPWN